jgi:hypothetical protein
VHQYLDQGSGGAGGQINHRVALTVPARRSVEAPATVKRTVVADSPEKHSGKHTFVNLQQHFLHQTPSGFGDHHLEWGTAFKSRLRLAHPPQRGGRVS